MGTITARELANGKTAYRAEVVIKEGGRVVYRRSRSFERRSTAQAWMDRHEREMRKPGAIEAARLEAVPQTATLAEVITDYVRDHVRIGRTKAQVLRAITALPIAARRVSEIRSADLIGLARELAKDREPATVQNYLSHLGGVLRVARASGHDVDRNAIPDALDATRRLGLTGKARKRDRRPTRMEIEALLQHFAQVRARRPGSIDMRRVILFAFFSSRRQEEIVRIEWRDLEPGRVIVRDMKHPGDKIGNDVRVDLPPEAEAIARAMPRTDARIFPYSTDAVGAAFTRACKLLQINDLRFHDLRHEGVSRLFEMGWTIPQVAQVSGHRSWQSLQRYTHLRASGDPWAGWPWQEHAGLAKPE